MMNLIQRLIGTATPVSAAGIESLFRAHMIRGEEILVSYRLLRDALIFTNLRVVLVDVQGVTGAKQTFRSVPYHAISYYLVESAGTLGVDARIRIYVASGVAAIEKRLHRGADVAGINRLLTERCTFSPESES